MDSKKLMKRLTQIDDLPTLPVIAMEVNKMLKDYEISIEKLSGVIEKDQAMVPRILKLVNSSFYGFKSRVANINRAIILLGFNTIRNAVVAVSIIEALAVKKPVEGFDIKEFWMHSVAVAVISKYLAGETRLNPPEDAFTGGLLHDLGKVILSQFFPELFRNVLIFARENNCSFYEAEKKEIYITHANIGTYMARKWKLPESLADTIRYHHALKKNVNDFNLLILVHTADTIANSFVNGKKEKPDLSLLYPDAAKKMKPQLDNLMEWFPEIQEEIESACRFFLDGGE